MNRVVPTVSPVASSVCSTPLLLVEETGEIQNTAAIEGTLADSNIISLTNSQRPGAAMILAGGQQHVSFKIIKMDVTRGKKHS